MVRTWDSPNSVSVSMFRFNREDWQPPKVLGSRSMARILRKTTRQSCWRWRVGNVLAVPDEQASKPQIKRWVGGRVTMSSFQCPSPTEPLTGLTGSRLAISVFQWALAGRRRPRFQCYSVLLRTTGTQGCKSSAARSLAIGPLSGAPPSRGWRLLWPFVIMAFHGMSSN